MKGLYLTEEGKKVIEDYLEGLNTYLNPETLLYNDGKIDLLKEILSSATIVPVEKNWDGVFDKTFSQSYIEKDYPNGVVIKSKQ
jgi:hypothetical protein